MRLIDADKLLSEIQNSEYYDDEQIINAPTVDAVERKRGEWIFDIAYYDEDGCPCICLRCSECGEAYPKSNYCPNCGADMRKGEEE